MVTQESGCVYKYQLTRGATNQVIDVSVDYSTAYDIRDTGIGIWEIKFSNSCPAKVDGKCESSVVSPYGGNFERARNALACLKKEFCDGNAF